MKHPFHFLAFFALFVVSYPTRIEAQEPGSSKDQSPPSNAPQPKAKKIWTNENISSVQGGAYSVGSATLPSSARDLQTYSNGATFLRPHPGDVFHPGETFKIELSVEPDVRPVKAVGIVSRMGFSNEDREGPPYEFTFTIPNGDRLGGSGPLIGLQQLTLFGTVVGRKEYDLAVTTIDVEEADLPISLQAAGGMMSHYDPVPNHVRFYTLGYEEQIEVLGKFPNGHELNVTESTHLSLSSENPAVARVSGDGTIISVGQGETHVIATYALESQQARLSIPVTVGPESSHVGVTVSPATVDFGDVPVGSSSPPRQITITNDTHNELKIYDIAHWAFPAGTENCSHTILPVGTSCTLNITFKPIRPGPVHLMIFVENSFTSGTTIVLVANGT